MEPVSNLAYQVLGCLQPHKTLEMSDFLVPFLLKEKRDYCIEENVSLGIFQLGGSIISII